MAIVDVDKLNAVLVKKLVAFCNKATCCKGEITHNKVVNLFSFEFVNDGECANDLKHIISKDPRAICVFLLKIMKVLMIGKVTHMQDQFQ